MRYRIVANLASGGRVDLLTFDEGQAYSWWGRVKTLDLAGPNGASLSYESREDDRKDIVLAMTGAT